MPSFLHLRYSGKIKQFKWPVEPAVALQNIATAFRIQQGSIVGLQDKDGKLHDINELFKNPEEATKQSFMLITKGEDKRVDEDSPIRQIRNMANFGDHEPETPSLDAGLILISNFPEFEKSILQNNHNSTSLIFVLERKQQLEEVVPKITPLVNQYSDRIDFYNYVCKGANDNINVLSGIFPSVLVYNGAQRLVEIPLGSNIKNLANLLERIQPKNKVPRKETTPRSQQPTPIPTPTQQQQQQQPRPVFPTEDNLSQIEELFGEGEITDLEYYFLKSAVLEKRNDVVSLLQRFSKTQDIEQLKQEISEIRQPAGHSNKKPQQQTLKQSGSFQPMKQNFMRPTTADNRGKSRGKSRGKEISSAQEKFIQIIADLERRSYLTEHSASLIKSLILEENAEVIKVLNAYEIDIYDEQELSFRLVRLAEKLSPYIVRPSSPLPKKDELIRLVNNLVRKRLKDDNLLLLLNKLILEGDELLYSTFEVFESDRDEEDLLDTLIRIVNRHKKSSKLDNSLYASPFYSSQQRLGFAESSHDGRKERSVNRDRPTSQGTISYFLESKSKSRTHSRDTSIDRSFYSRKETREHSIERANLQSRKEARDQSFDRRSIHSRKEFSPQFLNQDTPVDLSEALKNVAAIKNLPYDEYGIVFWMAKNKPSLIRDVINDHGGLEAIERAVPSILLLANKELSTNFKERFDEKQRQYINESKKIRNSATFAAFHCFKYDQDLDGLLNSLDDIVRNMPKIEVKIPSRKPSRTQEEISQVVKQINEKKKEAVTKKETQTKEQSSVSNLSPNYSPSQSELAVIREEDKANSKVNSQNRLPPDTEKPLSASQNSLVLDQNSNNANGANGSNNTTKNVASSNGTDTIPALRTSVSKYTPLLNRDTRADSFKGMFQLKLISSDNPNVTGTPVRDIANKAEPAQPKNEIVNELETKNSLDAHLNVIIPPKNEVSPFIQGFIDQFYESQGNSGEHYDKFKRILDRCSWLQSDDISKLETLYENFFYELFEVIYSYEGNKDLEELERRLKEDILTVDLDNISITSASPRERKRMATYHGFKALLQNLKNESRISEKQYKTYHYLYTEEDVTILAAYEVYQYTNDLADLIDTLLLIEKVQFFKNESKYFEDISNFNDVVEYQLKIIFSLKKHLNAETRAILEKIIRSGNTTVHQIYQNYKKNRDGQNKNDLIQKLVGFAEENAEIVKKYELSIAQQQAIGEEKNVKRKEQIEAYEANKMLKGVKHFHLLYDAIDRENEMLHSVFEVFDFNKDKNEFIENITIAYKFLQKLHAFEIIKKNQDKLGFNNETIDQIWTMIKKKDKIIIGPIELYFATNDEQDFLETVQISIQTMNKKAGKR